MVRLYGREGCGLCVEARAILVRLQRRYRFDIEDVDIDADPALHDRFFLEIPVVEIDGEVVAKAPISEQTLEDALAESWE